MVDEDKVAPSNLPDCSWCL